MRHFRQLSLLLLLTVSDTGYCFAQSNSPSGQVRGGSAGTTEDDLKDWKEFVSEEGRFSVLIPGVPKEVVREIDSPFGKSQGHYFNLSASADFGFSYTQFPVTVEVPEFANRLLDRARDGIIEGLKGKLLEEKDINLDGHPGRFIKAELTGGYTYRHKVFIVGSRSYQLVFISRDKGVPPAVLEHHESAAKRFLDSLKLRLLVAQVPSRRSCARISHGKELSEFAVGDFPA